ncbi:MAG TPA: CAP domain-containing protein [Campylobacterales bacterium]|nr:CAP domain-containing protein [Campylobacterales bacterium]
MKKQTVHTMIMGLLTLFAGYLYLVADTPPIQKIIIKEDPLLDIVVEEKEALSYLNKLRTSSGLIPLHLNPILSTAAKNHANYLIKHGRIGHYEEQNRSGFTGMYSSHRSIHAGYKTPMLIENVSSNNFSYKSSVDGLMAAIYHRFAFLDFHVDEIGIGVAQHLKQRGQTAFVYNMGSHKLNTLCQNQGEISSGEQVQNICSDKKMSIEKELFNEALHAHRYKNSPLVLYPYEGQKDVPPAFFEELPDPLPDHSVSGFPISISFNKARFKSIKMISFKIFDEKKVEITETISYNHQTDLNKRLKKFEFVLFPLQRLAWNHNYMVRAIYEANGILKKKIWHFKTRNFTTPVHHVTPTKNSFQIEEGQPNIFYFPPLSQRDTLGNLQYPASLDISFIDKNTIKLIANNPPVNRLILRVGKHTLNLNIKKN